MNLIFSKTIFAFYIMIENIKLFFEITKFRLSLLVALSSVFGFFISSTKVDINEVFILLVGGYLIGDINVTSPTGLPQYKNLTGKNLAIDFWNELEKLK